MSIVSQANPLNDSRRLENGSEICNSTIFRHLKDMGWSPKKMDSRIPTNTLGFFYLGDLYGYVVGLDYYGCFQFRDEIPGADEVVIVLEDSCEHGFVVRDIQGENRFLCKECDARFPRHPDMIEQEMFRPEEAGIFDSLAQFRDGLITFSKATEITGLTLEEFKGTIEKIFPAHDSIRTSCPAAIDALFSNPEVTLADIEAIVNSGGVFSDITEVRHFHSSEQMIIEIDFVDDSTQKIVMDKIALRSQDKDTRKFQDGGCHIITPITFNLLPYQLKTLKTMSENRRRMDPPDVMLHQNIKDMGK